MPISSSSNQDTPQNTPFLTQAQELSDLALLSGLEFFNTDPQSIFGALPLSDIRIPEHLFTDPSTGLFNPRSPLSTANRAWESIPIEEPHPELAIQELDSVSSEYMQRENRTTVPSGELTNAPIGPTVFGLASKDYDWLFEMCMCLQTSISCAYRPWVFT